MELATEPFTLIGIGMSVYLPRGATANANHVGGRTTVEITPPDSAWVIRIQTPKTTNPDVTIEAAANKMIQDTLQTADSIAKPQRTNKALWDAAEADADKVFGRLGRLLDRADKLEINGAPAERFYCELVRPEGPRVIQGYTIFKPSATQFVVFELITSETSFGAARRTYETSVATANFADPQRLAETRRAAVGAGLSLFASLSEAEYTAAMHAEQRWYRLFKPAPTGAPNDASEIGYRSVRFWRGNRGEINAAPSAKPTAAEEQDGLLVRVTARVMGGNTLYDTMATYFMSPDRAEEAWSVDTEIQAMNADPRKSGRFSETGARTDRSMSVLISQSGTPAEPAFRPLIEGDGYINQFETFLLPRLLVRSRVETEFGFYAYQSSERAISLRRDVLSRDPAAPGAVTILTSFKEGAAPQRSLYRENGDLIRTSLPEGIVWEPISLEELKRLWRSKDLPEPDAPFVQSGSTAAPSKPPARSR
ncbi:MAG: hypothetical protein JNM07_03130 [Phycisphaerae bacterium]|nr:hypothetical protein [Phycisphaerae bacterium]